MKIIRILLVGAAAGLVGAQVAVSARPTQFLLRGEAGEWRARCRNQELSVSHGGWTLDIGSALRPVLVCAIRSGEADRARGVAGPLSAALIAGATARRGRRGRPRAP